MTSGVASSLRSEEPSAPGSRPSAEALAPQNALVRRVRAIWARHQEWPVGRWRDQHDAVLIGKWVVALRLPYGFWQQAIDRIPVGRRFVWAVSPPEPGRVSLLEELAIEWRFRKAAPAVPEISPIAASLVSQLISRMHERQTGLDRATQGNPGFECGKNFIHTSAVSIPNSEHES